ncbi:hypothetical protein MTO98_26005 [Mucilaginibacter sp. SMC90]|uniref:hypothetical protein n=1 Tax=Mucilaginibacter sp. SMC90 TaxID=2929803 RepID=UPI001FB4165C|nr:hypothetical protein [Mucilaginibacter sp. SMC90]UOE47869.1 hypothetical protein MTO98_26005 [Mucilaginibacter sp. SMC90]
MKNIIQLLINVLLSGVLILGTSLNSYAQKLNNVQENSLPAPGNVKIDGKLTEWGDALQAYNKATQLYYTISNDDHNLYLAIKSTDQTNSRKIVAGGISFTINTQDKKKSDDAYVLTFPMVNAAGMRNQFHQRGGGPGGQRQALDSAAIADMRKQALAAAKEISLSGFKDIADSVISIYNEYGIKAAVSYDNNGNFVYELGLPLKLLGIVPGEAKEFAYNLKVNGIRFGNRGGGADNGNEGGNGGNRGGFGGGGGRRGGGGGFGGARAGGGGTDMQSLMSPTDFWGKYIPAKK